MSEVSSSVDSDVDLWAPVEPTVQLCPYCQKVVGDAGFWVIENPSDGFYTGYCNSFHYDIHHKQGLFAEDHPPALSMED